MVPDCRDFDKDSKKVFIYYFRIFIRISIDFKNSLQTFKNKSNIMFKSLGFAERPLKRIGVRNPAPGRRQNRGGAAPAISGD